MRGLLQHVTDLRQVNIRDILLGRLVLLAGARVEIATNDLTC
jgi:hypothetical protein